MDELYHFPAFLTAQEIQQVLRISLSATYTLFHDPTFPVVKIGGRYRVPRNEFDRWIQDHLPDRASLRLSTDVHSIYAIERKGSKNE